MKRSKEKTKQPQEDQEDEEAEDVHRQNGDRVCEQCGKRFQNGKALGGHIKVHFNQPLLPKKTITKSRSNKHASFDEGNTNSSKNNNNNNRVVSVQCYVCNKDFPSIKSLHGHMRLHRERDWKGVKPPGDALAPGGESNSSDSNENESSEEADDDHDDDDDDGSFSDHSIETATDAANFLVNWKKIEERRRRRSQIANQTVHNYTGNMTKAREKEESPENIKFGGGSMTKAKVKEESPENIKFDGVSRKKVVTMEESKSFGGTKPMKGNGFLDRTQKNLPRKVQDFRSRRSDAISDVSMAESVFSSKYADDQVEYKGTPLKFKFKLKGKALKEEDKDDDNDQNSRELKPKKMMMKTSPPSKTGNSPIKDRALLHQTHKQIPRKSQEFGTRYAEKGKYHGTRASSTRVLDRAEKAEPVEHIIKQFACNICPCKFTTGQALGGHKRGHNHNAAAAAPVEEAQTTVEVASVDLEDGEIATDTEKFTLDLNQPPSEAPDEGAGQ